jgi:hypothetical protein
MRSFAPVFLIALTACSVKTGDGVIASEARELDSFAAVTNNADIPMSVEVGPEHSVELVCDENLLAYIETRIVHDSLELNVPADLVLEPSAKCALLVTMPSLTRIQNKASGGVEAAGLLVDLDYVRNTGWGTVTAAGIEAGTLRVISEWRGRMVLAGTAQAAILDNDGAGGIEALELVCNTADIDNSGNGDVTVTVTDYAQVSVTGDGDVVLEGDPDEVEVADDGCGDVY